MSNDPQSNDPHINDIVEEDIRQLHRLGYAQELLRRMSGFSNYAISLSIICILAGGLTSFQVGLCSVGGASIGIGWPVVCLFSLVVAATMGQVASAFPTAGGLYHWASILGSKGWGWAVAWFNLAGLVTVLAAINVGAYRFVLSSVGSAAGFDIAPVDPDKTDLGYALQIIGVVAITFTQALFNHLGIRVTTLLTDFSGWWIMAVALALTALLLAFAPAWDFSRLVTFTNYSGLPTGEEATAIWPKQDNIPWLFLLGFLLPAYTLTGFDASAHTAEETVNAAINVPRSIVRSVLVSGLAGWVMLIAIVLAIPDLNAAAQQGDGAVTATVNEVLPAGLAIALFIGIGVAQYLCGLATVTSASRMTYAFARDGGLPYSSWLKMVSPTYRTPVFSIWAVAIATVVFTVYTPVYVTITVVCTLLLYISYVLPTAMGFLAHGRSWTTMGPWHLGVWYRPLAVVAVLGCGLLIVIGVQPPNEKALWTIGGMIALLTVVWFGSERRRFPGPPQGMLDRERQAAIVAAEKAVGQP
jgi:amino acid transporter